jgi:serine/threonine-protein kinase
MSATLYIEHLNTALVDRYEIERELGTGEMAVVYLAPDLKHARPVAIKVLRPEVAASLGADRFLREVRVGAKLNHPKSACVASCPPATDPGGDGVV